MSEEAKEVAITTTSYYCPGCSESTEKSQNKKLKQHKLSLNQKETDWRWCDYAGCCVPGKETEVNRIVGISYQCENGDHDYCGECMKSIQKKQDKREI